MEVIVERRCCPVPIELRDDAQPELSGYAAVYYDGTPDTEFELFSGFRERIMPGAFDRALSERDDVRALFNHEPAMVLGRTPGTLTLTSDNRGLAYRIALGETTLAKDVRELVRRGDVTGSSFAFTIEREEREDLGNGAEVRKILAVRLYDVGPVTYPAYEATTAEARSAIEGDRARRYRRREIDRRVRRLEIVLDVARMTG